MYTKCEGVLLKAVCAGDQVVRCGIRELMFVASRKNAQKNITKKIIKTVAHRAALEGQIGLYLRQTKQLLELITSAEVLDRGL